MREKRMWRVILLGVMLAGLFAGGAAYLNSVHDALWTKAVADILEVTDQGRHALDTYIEKDRETLRLLAASMESMDPGDTEEILETMQRYGAAEGNYLCVDLERGTAYTDQLNEEYALDAEQLARLRALEGAGLRAPFLDGYTGVWMIGMYERFLFADGTEGCVQRSQPVSAISDRFSISFYNDRGFSYVVDRNGDILIRSLHRNSNRTFQNLFDIIDLQNNAPQELDSFRRALEEGKRGVARFRYRTEDYVFCYVPLESAADWDVVSIIPNQVIMEQADGIVRHSQLLIVLILAGALASAAVFLTYRDSTRRVLRAEEEARRAAESASLAKSRFLSNMSHDIRTPMNAVIGMTELAAEHADEPEKVREYLKNIKASGRLLVGLINDILDLSRIESGKMTLDCTAVSLAELMEDLVNVVQPAMEQKGQAFRVRLHQVKHETLCTDALRLNQVLMNLLSNAVKFTPEGGSIRVDVTESGSPRPGCARFTFRVADTGIGMKPEFLRDIFDSFTREQDSRVSRTEGSGLGMAITKMIVDLMEGSIQVESAPGEGSVFTVTLDLPPAEEPREEPLPPMRVLVADGDSEDLRSAEESLRALGVQADGAADGRSAAAMAAAGGYALAFLGWELPDMDGGQAVRAVREALGETVPVVVCPACGWEQVREEALQCGAAGVVQKPLFRSTLRRSLRRYALHKEPQAARSDSETLSGLQILLAEDNRMNQEIARELLESFGARVEVADNGLDCVERFSGAAPGWFDLILMDVHMPLMDGYEATRQIRELERPDAGTVPILALTADAFAEDVAAAKEAGMNGHLAKPLDISVMLKEIQACIGRTGWRG